MHKDRTSFIEFFPTILFGLSYVFYDLFTAIAVLMISSVISISIIFYYNRKLSWLLIISSSFILLFGGLTLFSGNPIFIKIKPTIVYLIFSLCCLYDSLNGAKYAQKIFSSIHPIRPHLLAKFARNSFYFFVIISILNEVVWRNFSEETWVFTKAVIFPLCNSLYFGIYIFSLIKRVE